MARSVVFDFIARDRQYTGPLRRMEGTTTRFGATLGKVSGVAVRAFGGVGVAALGLGIAGATMGIKTAAGLEQAEIGFTSLLKSGTKARKFLGDLKSFAAKTPFELPGLIEAARGLVGAGTAAKDVIPILTDLGDASGALGLDQERFGRVMIAVTQIMNKGKLQAEELMQITEAGIPVWPLLAKAMHKPVPELQKMMQHGDLLSKDVLPLLFDQMHKDYGGSMAKQSTTLSGLWSTFMDTLNLGLADVIKPFEGELKSGLKGAIEIAQGAFKAIADFITGTVIPGLKTLRQWWKDNKGAVKDLSDAFLATFVPAVDTAKTSTDDLSTAQERLGKKFTGAAIFAAELVKWWIETRIQTTELMKATYNLIIALGYGANALDLISGGSGHAADAIVKFGREGKRVADDDLVKLRKAAGTTQAAIDAMHGKSIPIKAHTSVEVAESVQKYLAAAGVPGFRAKGGLTRLGETAIVGEEGPELVKFTRPAYVYTAAETRGIMRRGLASGGPVGDALTGRFYNPTVRQTGRIGQSMADVAAAVLGRAGSLPGPVGGAGSALAMQVAKWTVAALHRPLAEIGAWFRRLMFESGGNPRAINRWDSNWFAGHPSVGIAQVIRGTFAAHAGRFRKVGPFAYGVSMDPFANSYAGAHYGLGRYNSLFALDPRRRPRGYDFGGFLPPGLSLAWNGTGQPERVGGGDLNLHQGAIQVFASPGMNERRVAQLIADELDERRRRGRKGGRA